MEKVEYITKRVTVVIPCRNEEGFIGQVLDNVVQQDYPSNKLEVFVVDGNSNDKTAEIIQEYSGKYEYIHYLKNSKKVVPYALNKAIRKSTGDIIVRMDAHSIYPADYISMLVKGLYDYECDNTGGVWITEPANDSFKAKSIADATSHPFGIGNAHYRLDIKSPKKVDTVPFGCYRKEVFENIGLFDEELVRNQDDEFNARLIKHGGTIFLLPDVKIRYFARENFKKTSRMFYQYGLYKPLVNLKVGQPATMRQFVPPLFTLFIILFSFMSLIDPMYLWILGAGTAFYLLVDLVISTSIVLKKAGSIFQFPSLLAVFPIIHISYGLGYLGGIVRFLLFKRPIHHSKVNISR